VKTERWIVLAAALLATALTARLGLWQLDRAAQKNALQSALDSRRSLPALAQADLARDPAASAAQHHRAIEISGLWMTDKTVFLENRQMNGRPGFYVVTPLLLADGTAVIVQRGWSPRSIMDRTQVVAPPLPSGIVTVQGRIAPPPGRLYEFDGVASGPIRQNLDLAAYAREVGRTVRPLSVLQEDRPEGAMSPAADGLLRQWPRPAADVHKHYGYAFQWFALSALIVGLYVWFQLVRPRQKARSSA